uniref:helix-turn-helix domain-containing protein n=1 Tax=Fodinicola feengrottensis TaxID=435914 RepID=UPI0036F3FE66
MTVRWSFTRRRCWDTLIALFEAIWGTAVPVRFDEPSAGQPAQATGQPRTVSDRQLLSLLAAGLTDEAIGRHLGWHPRTVQRHLRDIMADLGAQTRFQAGLQAGRRGWL